jgi:hypothetical protein
MNPQFKISLYSLFNKAYANAEPALKRAIRPRLNNPEFRRIFSDSIIERIVERTQSGVNKKDEDMGGYSPRYRESLVFKIYKGFRRNVDLTLTSNMLSSLKALQLDKTIIIELEGQENKVKAYAHITGFRGHPYLSGKVKKRDFLGLPESEQIDLLRQSLEMFANISEETIEGFRRSINEATSQLEIETDIETDFDDVEE